jgi:hypothetical protein
MKKIFLVHGGTWTPADDLNSYRPTGKFGDDFIFVVDEDAYELRSPYGDHDPPVNYSTVDFSRGANALLDDVLLELDTQRSVYYQEDIKSLIRSLKDSPYEAPGEPSQALVDDFGPQIASYLMRFAGTARSIDIPEKIISIFEPVNRFGIWHIPEGTLDYDNRNRTPQSLFDVLGATTASEEALINAGFEKWKSSLCSRSNYLDYYLKFEVPDFGRDSRNFDDLSDEAAQIVANRFAERFIASGVIEYFAQNGFSYHWLWRVTNSICSPASHVKYPPWLDCRSDEAFLFQKKVRGLIDDIVVREWGNDPTVQRWRHGGGEAHKGDVKVFDQRCFWTSCAVCIEEYDAAILREEIRQRAQVEQREAQQEALRAAKEAQENRLKEEEARRDEARKQVISELVARAEKIADEADKLVKLGCSRTAALRTVSTKYEEMNRPIIYQMTPTITETPTEFTVRDDFFPENFPPPSYPSYPSYPVGAAPGISLGGVGRRVETGAFGSTLFETVTFGNEK